MSSYKELIVWQKSIQLVTDIYKLTKTFPKEEIYGLASQMQRAVVSIPSNIAEGNDRNSSKEFSQFLRIARGSLAELETQIIISEKLEYTNKEQIIPILNNCYEIGRMINGLLVKFNQLLATGYQKRSNSYITKDIVVVMKTGIWHLGSGI